METLENETKVPELTPLQTSILTLLDQVAARVVDGSIKAVVITSVMSDGLGRNAYIIAPNTAVTLVGSLEVAKHELIEGILQEARQALGVPQEPRGGKTDAATADALLPRGVIGFDTGEMPEHQSMRGEEIKSTP